MVWWGWPWEQIPHVLHFGSLIEDMLVPDYQCLEYKLEWWNLRFLKSFKNWRLEKVKWSNETWDSLRVQWSEVGGHKEFFSLHLLAGYEDALIWRPSKKGGRLIITFPKLLFRAHMFIHRFQGFYFLLLSFPFFMYISGPGGSYLAKGILTMSRLMDSVCVIVKWCCWTIFNLQ